MGPKTGAKWLQQYGTLDGIIAHADEIEGKVGENLRAGLATLELSRRLATIRTDLELPLALEELAPRAPRRARRCASCTRGSSCAALLRAARGGAQVPRLEVRAASRRVPRAARPSGGRD